MATSVQTTKDRDPVRQGRHPRRHRAGIGQQRRGRRRPDPDAAVRHPGFRLAWRFSSAGLILLGIAARHRPWPTRNLDLTYTIIWSLAIANVIGTALCIILRLAFARLTTIRYTTARAVHDHDHLLRGLPGDAVRSTISWRCL